jgi:hypothetical protein
MQAITTSPYLWQPALLVLQAAQVLFLWAHDWVPLGRLNDVVAVKHADTTRRLAIVTLIQSVPFTIGLFYSVRYEGQAYPHWLFNWLWISYGILLLGQLRAWWFPYFFVLDPERVERYKRMFGKTYSFVPTRNGITPNTAHVLLHLCTAATLILLLVATYATHSS